MALRPLAASLLRGPWPWLGAISLTGWAALAGTPPQLALPAFCGSLAGLASQGPWSGLLSTLALDPVGLLISWMLMLLAMMPLLLASPIALLWQRSLPRRRVLALMLFCSGYLAIWTAAGVLIALLSVAIKLIAGEHGLAAPLAGLGLLLLWQASPAKQTGLNRCHGIPRLSAFGWPMIRDCLRYGLVNGLWCIVSCWPAMLLPSLVERGHALVMLACMLWLVVERLRPARAGRWRWPLMPPGLVRRSSP